MGFYRPIYAVSAQIRSRFPAKRMKTKLRLLMYCDLTHTSFYFFFVA